MNEKHAQEKKYYLGRLGVLAEKFSDLFVNKLNFSQINNALLYLYQDKIEKMKPSDLLKNYTENRLVRPSEVNQEHLCEFDLLIMRAIGAEYQKIEVSPVVPIGSSSLLTHIDSKTILQTIRSAEVIPDTSIALALESAMRRSNNKERSSLGNVNLASSQRLLRLQSFQGNKDLVPHFGSYVLSTAGRDTGNYKFEQQAALDHISNWLNVIQTLKQQGYQMDRVKVYISNIAIIEELIARGILNRDDLVQKTRQSGINIFESLGIGESAKVSDLEDVPEIIPGNKLLLLSKFKENYLISLTENEGVEFVFDLSRIAGLGYYKDLCFKIKVVNPDNSETSIIDGGTADWTEKLLSDSKERFFSSGIGSELVIQKYRSVK